MGDYSQIIPWADLDWPPAMNHQAARSLGMNSAGVMFFVMATEETGDNSLGLYYSTDLGATWNEASYSGTQPLVWSGNTSGISMFIDSDDYLHFVYVPNDNVEHLDYVRASWSGSTATFGTALNIDSSGCNKYNVNHSLVAFPDPGGGGGWNCFVHFQQLAPLDPRFTKYVRVDITSGGSASVGIGPATALTAAIGHSALATTLDFHHDGDGKTVSGSDPHVYFGAYQMTTTDRPLFRRLAYSAGWSFDSQYDGITSGNSSNAGTGFFDGIKWLFVALEPSPGLALNVWELTPATPSGWSLLTTADDYTWGSRSLPSVQVDSSRDIHVISEWGDLYYNRYDRVDDAWDTWATVPITWPASQPSWGGQWLTYVPMIAGLCHLCAYDLLNSSSGLGCFLITFDAVTGTVGSGFGMIPIGG